MRQKLAFTFDPKKKRERAQLRPSGRLKEKNTKRVVPRRALIRGNEAA